MDFLYYLALVLYLHTYGLPVHLNKLRFSSFFFPLAIYTRSGPVIGDEPRQKAANYLPDVSYKSPCTFHVVSSPIMYRYICRFHTLFCFLSFFFFFLLVLLSCLVYIQLLLIPNTLYTYMRLCYYDIHITRVFFLFHC